MLTVRHVTIAPDGTETEVSAVHVPQAVEAQGGDAIMAYVAAQLAAPPVSVPVPVPAEES